MPIQSKPTQDFVPIKEVRDGIVTLKDGTLCAILMASSTNFALKSSDEQEAVLNQFRNFLNSLDFSVQFFVQSRKLNIDPYLNMLGEELKKQSNELLSIQTKEYIQFVKTLVSTTNIVAKNFYVVVPYSPKIISVSVASPFGKFFSFGKKTDQKTETENNFLQNRTQLEQRVNTVQAGLSGAGVRTTILSTEEIIELFYKLFNPGEIQGSMVSAITNENAV